MFICGKSQAIMINIKKTCSLFQWVKKVNMVLNPWTVQDIVLCSTWFSTHTEIFLFVLPILVFSIETKFTVLFQVLQELEDSNKTMHIFSAAAIKLEQKSRLLLSSLLMSIKFLVLNINFIFQPDLKSSLVLTKFGIMLKNNSN
jgi:hypothetical protein